MSSDEEDDEGELAVDPGLEKVNPKVFKLAMVVDGDCSARLSLIDPAKNSDKYYILQLIEAKGDFYVYVVPLSWLPFLVHVAMSFVVCARARMLHLNHTLISSFCQPVTSACTITKIHLVTAVGGVRARAARSSLRGHSLGPKQLSSLRSCSSKRRGRRGLLVSLLRSLWAPSTTRTCCRRRAARVQTRRGNTT